MIETTVCDRDGRFNDISRFHVRTNPRLQFVPFSEIGSAENAVLEPLIQSGLYAGILCDPDASSQTMKSVSVDTVRLFHELAVPHRVNVVPSLEAQPAAEKTMMNLILDGIIEISEGADYRTGASAYPILVGNDVTPDMSTRLSRLSMEALEDCSKRTSLEAIELSWRLYHYNRLPVSPKWSRKLPDGVAVLGLFDRADREAQRRRLQQEFRFVAEREAQGWLFWSRAGNTAHTEPRRRANCKLYISPMPGDIVRSFEAVVDLAPESEALGFKIGADAHGLMRPDKLIVYFEAFDQLLRFFEQCSTRLDGVAAHGVPFTAQLDEDGLFSWGMDPHVPGHLSWHSDDSWRIWVCNRLATAIREAHAAHFPAKDVICYALARLQLAGVDVARWSKDQTADAERGGSE